MRVDTIAVTDKLDGKVKETFQYLRKKGALQLCRTPF